MGSNTFCFKACDHTKSNDAHYCEHVFDRIGCAYNAPNNAQNGTFESCEGDNQDFPGVYTQNGQVFTYTQPPEALGAIGALPYTARVPASSNCVQMTSSAIYTGLPKVGAAASSVSVTGSGSSSKQTAGSATQTGGGPTSTNSGERRTAGLGLVFGVAISVTLLI
jgi:hypothetical protein